MQAVSALSNLTHPVGSAQSGSVKQSSQQTFPGLNLTLPSSIAQLSSGAGQTPLSSTQTPDNDQETFRFSSNLPYNYSESSNQGFALREAGSSAGGCFSLGSVTESTTASGTYSLNLLQGQQNASGTFSDSQDGSLFTNGANLLAQVSSSSTRKGVRSRFTESSQFSGVIDIGLSKKRSGTDITILKIITPHRPLLLTGRPARPALDRVEGPCRWLCSPGLGLLRNPAHAFRALSEL